MGRLSLRFKINNWFIRGSGSIDSTLVRGADGAVSVTSLGSTWTPVLSRQPNGTVEIS